MKRVYGGPFWGCLTSFVAFYSPNQSKRLLESFEKMIGVVFKTSIAMLRLQRPKNPPDYLEEVGKGFRK